MTEPRPFYHRFAWAYDLLLDEPVDERVRAIAKLLGRLGVSISATVLDAGCGTGRYAVDLADRGFHVVGIDRSPELISVARSRSKTTKESLEFVIGDFTALTRVGSFDAILCRGVLNDMLTDAEPEQAALRFAEFLTPGGALLLDVRDWQKTTRQYASQSPKGRLVTLPDGQRLHFAYKTLLEPATQQIVVSEAFEFHRAGGVDVERYVTEFRMRCWSEQELHQHFDPHFADVEILPDYAAPPSWNDRLVFLGTRR
jgi:2-polyprenyl-3-methyl-5-hydroxy-6-metoxy-1,4-benzoquinol methylase